MILLLAALLIVGNAFFVGAQFALITARRDQVEPVAARGSHAARATLGEMRQLSRMLAGSQLGIAICSLGLGAVGEPAIARVLEGGFDALRLPATVLHPAAFAIALALVSYAHMVLGEMVPKNLALAGPLRAALLLGPPMSAWVRLTRPLLVVINMAANGVLLLLRVEPKHELTAAYTPQEIAHLIDESAAEGLLDASGQQQLARALSLERRTAVDAAIPLDDLVTLGPGSTAAELEDCVASTGYSRFPVRAASPSAIPAVVGYVHAKDLLQIDDEAYDEPIPPQLIRPMVLIDAEVPLIRALAALQQAGQHMGLVLDKDTTVGAITLEDMLSELVGTIRDGGREPDSET